MSSRRTFMKQTLGGSAALAASGFFSSSRVLGANDRIRIGLIGGGDRGQEILHAAIRLPQRRSGGSGGCLHSTPRRSEGHRSHHQNL